MSESESEIWPKKIRVDKRIVKILSESTYDSFPQSLKELIVNSYDADSKNVNINIDINKEIITIEDNGWGMSVEDFDFYINIAGQRREKNNKTRSGRPVIGQFGVGFLSIFPFFKNYHIESKRAESKETLFADIPCYKYFAQEKGKLVDISSINISGGVKYSDDKKDSFTKITLTGFTPLAKDFFFSKPTAKISNTSISKRDGLTKLRWYLEDDLPIQYEDEQFNEIFRDEYTGYPFEVKINNVLLKRRVYGKVIMDSSKGIETFGSIKFTYFICSNEAPVLPAEATGLKVRNLNVGVGKRTTFGLGIDKGGTRSRLRWLTGEIHILEGLNDLIRVSRDDFYFSNEYDDLKTRFIKILSSIVKTLEDENELSTFFSTNKVKNLKLLEKDTIQKKIDKVVDHKINKTKVQPGKSNSNTSTRVDSNNLNQEIIKAKSEDYDKKYIINGYTFKLETEAWDYSNTIYSACRIEGDKLIINKKYPLYAKTKHLDVFIRLHALLLIWQREGQITQSIYNEMSKDILNNFKELI